MELLSHISWREWNEESFKIAQKEDKPILLSISALWCHWCHVMDNTTYSDRSVIEIIGRDFVPVRVNTDKRPDINERYNMGGWPSTVFLTPGGDIITGGTYIPPELMIRTLIQVKKLYTEKKQELLLEISLRNSAMNKDLVAENCDEKPVMNDVEDAIIINFDREFGGFGTEPKFPQIDVLLFALRQGFIHDDNELLELVEISLKRMAESKIYDHIDSGFFRYATKRNWTEPHYEKMLEDNAGFLRLYTEAFQVFKNETYKNIAEEISSFLLNKMYDNNNHYFYGSIDADEKYYLSDAEERKRLLFPAIDRTMYTNWNAEVVDAMIYSGSVLNKDSIIQTAFNVLDSITEKSFDSEGNIYHYINGKRNIMMLLTDIYSAGKMYLTAYSFSGNKKYLDLMLQLINRSTDVLYDNKTGGFFDRPSSEDDFGALKKREKPFILNSKIAELLALCASITSDNKWRKMAEEILNLFAGVYRSYSIFSASYASAFFFTKAPSLQLNIIGKPSSKETIKMMRESYNFYYPGKCLILLDAERDGDKIRSMGFDSSVIPVVYPCEGRRCLSPIKAPPDFTGLLEELKK